MQDAALVHVFEGEAELLDYAGGDAGLELEFSLDDAAVQLDLC